MGCGGSKQQDVATGNTVSTGKLSQKEATASKSKASSTTTDVSSADNSSQSIVEKAEMADTNGGLQGNEKPTASMVVGDTEEEQLTTNETPNEYLSPRKDAEIVEAEAGGEEVDHLSLRKDRDANVVEEEGMEEELKETETETQEEEKEEVDLKNDDDGDSIGKSSNDFKETLSVEETDEGEVVIAEKKIVGEGALLSGSSAP
ncbi:resistance to inhibitors of cholinesterase protein 3-like [Phoenix dactylifera]|uniref:Resistance to inhibitors of cholinesterase protein 3-like n=1 Tax=Phoenix dactylifera TaxID=42345 RepID=A0A8B9ARK3_PHODC|nr:resistance to inhibitors of cholinesterase protein 3-like [Phoenix dactylifera]